MSGLKREENDKPVQKFSSNEYPFGAPIRTPPPGFLGSSSGVMNGASLSSFAESLRAASASAPPPPGFGIAPDQRQLNNSGNQLAEDGNRGNPLFLQPSDFSLDFDCDGKKRTKSFANLAAALGEGLAESMDDSFADAKFQQMLQQSNKLSLAEPHGEIDNFARQSRHTVSRLIGAPSGHDSDKRFSQNLANDSDHALTNLKPFVRDSNHGLSHPDTIFPLSNSSSDRSNLKYFQAASLSNRPSSSSSNGLVSVVEPNSRTSPAPLNGTTQNYTSFPESFSEGRASAPPHMNDPQPRQFGASSAVLRSQHASSLQRRVEEFRSLKHGSTQDQNILNRTSVVEFSKTPEPSFENSPNINSFRESNNEQKFDNDRELELQSVNLLANFLVQTGPGESCQKMPSRALVILFASRLSIPDVRSTCEAFGSLQYFRSEFSKTRGIIFVAYHDLRSAHHAAEELKSSLKRLAVPHNDVYSNSSQDDIEVMHCISLDACSAKDHSTINLSNLPTGVDDRHIRSMLTSFGAVRSVQIQSVEDGESDMRYYSVEFFDTQDAAQAMLEIESTMPWGPGVNLEVKLRNRLERKQGQELLTLIGRWRRGENTETCSASTKSISKESSQLSYHNQANPSNVRVAPSDSTYAKSPSPLESSTSSAKPALVETASVSSSFENQSNHGPCANNNMHVNVPEIAQGTFQTTPQLVLGPDGQYSYMLVDQLTHAPAMQPTYMSHQQSKQGLISPQQQFIGAPIGAPNAGFVTPMHSNIASQTPNYHDAHGHHYYVQHHPHSHHIHSVQSQFIPSSNVVSHTQYVDARTGQPIPIYSAPVPGANVNLSTQTDSSLSSTSSGHINGGKQIDNRQMNYNNGATNTTGSSDTATHLELDIDAVKRGEDTRTSVMVRNIPNKYTQRMLLAEFTECGHGSDKIDFLYLPIDFKNKCNRGYAFVNFVDFRDIFHFYKKYNGQSWKVFNSDKICKITYARIQGKAGMLKRFENSALMEKDLEYRPIVFVSHGPRKGQLEDFPTSSK